MTYEIKFDLIVPDEVSAREAQITVNDALQAMTARESGYPEESRSWGVMNIQVVAE